VELTYPYYELLPLLSLNIEEELSEQMVGEGGQHLLCDLLLVAS
jgi:hypothetical protein